MSDNTIKPSDDYIMQILMEIKSDVSSIKSDVANLKDNTKEDICSLEKRVDTLEASIGTTNDRITELENSFNNSDDKKDANKYRRIVAYLLTAGGGILVAKIPDLIRTLIVLWK